MEVIIYNLFETTDSGVNRKVGQVVRFDDSQKVTLKELIDQSGTTYENYFVAIVNGRRQEDNYILKHNDKIHFVPMIGGG